MTTAASPSHRRLGRPINLPGRIARLARSPALRALVGAHLVAAAVILLRGAGWLQPAELLVYDASSVAWAGGAPSNRVVLVGTASV